MEPLPSDNIRGNRGTLTVPRTDSGSLDTATLEAVIDALVAAGVDGIYSNGSAREFDTQTEEELDAICRIFAGRCEAAGMPFKVGGSHMSAVTSLQRLQRAVAYAPGAVQLILPGWFAPTDTEIIDFLKRMEEAAGAKEEAERLRPIVREYLPEFFPSL